MSDIREKTTLIGITAMLHDIGKMYQRAGEKLSDKWRSDSVFFQQVLGNKKSHYHVLHTGCALDRLLGENARLRRLWTKHFHTDPVIISAAHHNPPAGDIPAQVIHKADCIAAGLDREEYDKREESGRDAYKNVMLSPILNHIRLWEKEHERDYRHKIGLFSAKALFPVGKSAADAQSGGYNECIKAFEKGFSLLNDRFERDGNLDFFAEGLETLLLNTTSFIPASTWYAYDEVSLFDHGKTTAALAASMYKTGLKKDNEENYLFIRGEFFGIQNFIFNKEGSNKKPAKILRGKSFYVSLMSEIASLLIIRELNLPRFNIMFNAAGAFVILADNTEETRAALDNIRKTVTDWLYNKYYGMVSMGIAAVPASADGIVKQFHQLWEELIYEMGKEKASKFNLSSQKALFGDYHKKFNGGVKECSYCGIEPVAGSDENCIHCNDFIELGDALAKKPVLSFYPDEKGIFGKISYTFSDGKDAVSKLAIDMNDEYNGFRCLHYKSYANSDNDIITSFEGLGKSAEGSDMLGVLKADVDNLGLVFAVGLDEEKKDRKETFSRFSAVSRNIHFFFAYYISELANERGYKIYTVFAGGDDLFIVGAYNNIVELSVDIVDRFSEYTGHNPELTLSAGIGCFKPGVPIWFMAEKADELLSKAKNHSGAPQDKGRIAIFESVCRWGEFKQGEEKFKEMKKLLGDHDGKISTSLYYKLLEFADNQIKYKDRQEPELLMWRPRLRYHIARQTLKDNTLENRNKVCEELHNWIDEQPELLKTLVFLELYKNR